MAIVPYQSNKSLLDFGVYKPTYIGKPVEQYAKLMENLSQNNKSIIDRGNALDLALSSINVNPVYNNVIEQQKSNLKSGLNDALSNPDDYSMINAKLLKLARDFETNLELKEAVNRTNTYNNYLKEIKQRYNANHLDSLTYDWAMNHRPTEIQYDENGNIVPYTPPTVYNKFDYNTYLNKAVAGWKANKTQGTPKFIKTPNGSYWKTEYGEVIPDAEVRKDLKVNLLSNPDAVKYAEQLARIDGHITPEQLIDNWIDTYVDKISIDNSGATYGGFNTNANKNKNVTYFPELGMISQPQTKQDNKLFRNALSYLKPNVTSKDNLKQHAKANMLALQTGNIGQILNNSSIDKNVYKPQDYVSNIRNIPVSVNQDGTQKFNERNILENVYNQVTGNYKKLSERSDEELLKYKDKAAEFIEKYYNEDRLNTSIIPDYDAYYMNQQWYVPGFKNPTEQFLTFNFGNKDGLIKRDSKGSNKDWLYSGAASNMIVVDPETGVVQNFNDLINSDKFGNVNALQIKPLGVVGPSSGLMSMYGDQRLASSVIVNINGKNYYMSNPANVNLQHDIPYAMLNEAKIHKGMPVDFSNIIYQTDSDIAKTFRDKNLQLKIVFIPNDDLSGGGEYRALVADDKGNYYKQDVIDEETGKKVSKVVPIAVGTNEDEVVKQLQEAFGISVQND